METHCPGNLLSLSKATLFGSRIAPYHPLGGVEKPLKDVFADAFALEVVDGFNPDFIENEIPDLVIGYEDECEQSLPDESALKIVQYVENGGGLLLIHNGICWARNPIIQCKVGAKFTGHPDQEVMVYPVDKESAPVISHEVQSFRMREEPYRYEFLPDFDGDVFLRYQQDGTFWEAGWKLELGKGRIVCIQPGHYPEVFENVAYRKLLLACAKWCSGQLEFL